MKTWISLAGALALGLILSGCANDPKAVLSEAAACKTIGNAELALAPHVGKLDPKGRAVLDTARATVRPICGADKPPSDASAATAVLAAAMGQLQGLAAAFGK